MGEFNSDNHYIYYYVQESLRKNGVAIIVNKRVLKCSNWMQSQRWPNDLRNAGLDEAQAGIKIARRYINNLRYADDTTLMAEREEELKSLLMKVKEESEKAGLKLDIQITKIMYPVPSLQGK